MAWGDLKGALGGSSASITNPIDATGSVSVAYGDLIIAVIAETITLSSTGVTDNLGNSYTAQNAGTDAGTATGRCFYSIATVAGTLTAVHFAAVASSNDVAVAASVFTGPFGPIDRNIANGSSSDLSSPFSCPATGTLTQANEFVVCWGTANYGTVWTATSPLLLAKDQAFSTTTKCAIGYKVVSATTTTTPSFASVSNPTQDVLGTLTFRKAESLKAVTPVTWDTSAAKWTLTNGNLTAILAGGDNVNWQLIRSSNAKVSGLFYVEIKCTVAGTDTNTAFAFTDNANAWTGDYGVAAFNGGGLLSDGAGIILGTGTPPHISPVLNDVYGLTINSNTGKIWIALNNVNVGTGDPVAGTNPQFTFTPGALVLSPAQWSLINGTNGTWTLQATSASQTYPAPSGYTSWGDDISFVVGKPTIGAPTLSVISAASLTATTPFNVGSPAIGAPTLAVHTASLVVQSPAIGVPTLAVTYFVATVGSDGANGSFSAPWQTISHVNSRSLLPGNKVLFNSGDTFSGPLNAQTGVFFGTTGSGVATISSSGNNDGFDAIDFGGFTLDNLIFTGSGGASTGTGIWIYNDKGDGTTYSNITLSRLVVSEYGGYGLRILAGYGGAGRNGYDTVVLDTIEVHDCSLNTGSPINITGNYGSAVTAGAATLTNFMLKNINVHDCPGNASVGPNGIEIADLENGLLENSVASYIGANSDNNTGGGFGVEIYDCRNVKIRKCESHHNSYAGTGNGGGFSLSGGNHDCTIEMCYAHDNKGMGYFINCWNDGTVTESLNTTMRFCIGAFNGQQAFPQGNATGQQQYNGTELVIEADPGSTVSYHIHNNTLVGNNPRPGYSSLIEEYSGFGAAITASGFVSNNILVLTSGGRFISTDGYGSPGNGMGGGILYAGNDWYSTGTVQWQWHGTAYTGALATALAAWQSATGQEKISGSSVALHVDPLLNSQADAGTVGAYNPVALSNYNLQSSSPMKGVGLNILSQFSLSPGPNDYYGVPIPYGSVYNVGAGTYLEICSATNLVVGALTITAPTLSGNVATFTATSLVVGSPAIGAPALARVYNVLSGQTSTGVNLLSGDVMSVFAGGTAISCTVNSGALLYDYGITSAPVVSSGGSVYIGPGGGTEISGIVRNGGYFQINSGGSASYDTISSGGTWYIEPGGTGISARLSSGVTVFNIGVASGITVFAGAVETVYGVDTSAVVFGEQDVNGGATAIGPTVSSGGIQYNAGVVSGAKVVNGGTIVVYGTDYSAIISSGGIQDINAGGTAISTVISSGGTQNDAGLASGNIVYGQANILLSAVGTVVQSGGIQFTTSNGSNTIVSSGGIEAVYGNASATSVLAGGEQDIYLSGAAFGTIVNGGVVNVTTGGSASGATINSGTLRVESGGIVSGSFVLGAPAGNLRLDTLAGFTGTISGFTNDTIDAVAVPYTSGVTALNWSQTTSASGTLTLSSGAAVETLSLVGSYTSASFGLSADGLGGTMITGLSSAVSFGATSLVVGSPAIGAPALGKIFTATSLIVGSPVIGTPALGKFFTSTSLIVGSPVIGTPSVGEIFTGTSLVVGSPAIGNPPLGKVVSATSLVVASPAIGAPPLIDVVNMNATALVVASPAIGAPTMAAVIVCTASSLVVGSPVFGIATMVVKVNGTASNLVVGSPVIGVPALVPVVVCAANSLVVGSPAIAAPTINETQVLPLVTSVVVGSPAIAVPTMAVTVLMTAGALVVGSPAIASPAIGQKQALSSSPLVVGSPTIGNPAMVMVVICTASNLVVGSPAIGAPIESTVIGCSAGNLVVGSLTIGTPAMVVVGSSVASSLVVGSPAIASATFNQSGFFTSVSLVVGSLTISAPAMTAVANGSSTSLVVGSPVISAPTMAVTVVCTASSLVVGTPAIGSATFNQVGKFNSSSLVVASPAIGAPAEVTVVNESATALVVGSPVIGVPAMVVVVVCSAPNLVVGSPVIATATFNQSDAFSTTALVVGSPAIGAPTFNQLQVIGASALVVASPALGTPSLNQVQAMTAVALVVGSPAFGVVVLTPPGAVTAFPLGVGSPAIGAPGIGQKQVLAPSALIVGSPVLGMPVGGYVLAPSPLVVASPAIGQPPINQTQVATASPLVVGSPVLGAPGTGAAANLTASPLIVGLPVIGAPLPGVVTGVTSLVVASPAIGQPNLGQVHKLASSSLVTGSPTLGVANTAASFNLTAGSLIVASPAIGAPVGGYNLAPSLLVVAIPAIGQPNLGQTCNFMASSLVTASPAIGVGNTAAGANLTASSLIVGSPAISIPVWGLRYSAPSLVVGSPAIGAPSSQMTVGLFGVPTIVGSPTLDRPSSSTGATLTPTNLTVGSPAFSIPGWGLASGAIPLNTASPSLGIPALGQVHGLQATPVATASPAFSLPSMVPGAALPNAVSLVVGSPALGVPVERSNVAPSPISLTVASPTIDKPSIGQIQALIANGISVGSPVSTTPIIQQKNVLAAAGVVTGSPEFGLSFVSQHQGVVAANLVVGAPELGGPVLAQTNALTSSALVAGRPQIDIPSMGYIVNLTAVSLVTQPPVMYFGLMPPPVDLSISSPEFGEPALVSLTVRNVVHVSGQRRGTTSIAGKLSGVVSIGGRGSGVGVGSVNVSASVDREKLPE